MRYPWHLSYLYFFLLAAPAFAAPTGLLNDTGLTQCLDAGLLDTPCSYATGSDVGVNPGLDGRFGRDAKSLAGLTKVGGGDGGFDFTRICMNGKEAGVGDCLSNPAANTGASPAPTEWACTRDNVTQLVWSLETVLGINGNNAASTNPGSPIDLANTSGRCGYNSGWRLPTRREMLSIIHFGRSEPLIDTGYFPFPGYDYTFFNRYWTSDEVFSRPGFAWIVNVYGEGGVWPKGKSNIGAARLVRGTD